MFDSLPITYEVVARGLPKPEVIWLNNGKAVKADDRIKITNVEDKYTLENTNVLTSDAGEWTAVVKNRLAEKSISCLLDVIRKFHCILWATIGELINLNSQTSLR